MPAATCKDDLLAITQKEYEKLTLLIAQFEGEDMVQKDEDDVSVKDVVGHRAHWIELFLGWYHDGQAGKDVALPAKGYKWSDLKRYNAQLRAQQAHLSWDDVCAMLEKNHKKLIAFLTDLDEAALYGAPMKGGNSKWTTGRWAEAAGASHYRSCAKYVRARRKQLGKS